MGQDKFSNSRDGAANLSVDGGPVRVAVRRLSPQYQPEEQPTKSNATKIGHGLAKTLGINLNRNSDPFARGESVLGVSNAAIYVEQEPTVSEFMREHTPSWRQILEYFIAFFPFVRWIGRYNLQWFLGDLVAGITVGAVVVPQGMAYASLAQLSPEFGLYSSFMGVMIYWFFATSKDITIGPVAVVSTVTGTVVLEAKKTLPNVPGYQIASAVGIMAGSVVAILGVARIGWLIEFISLTAISAFMTGSALNIASGQIPSVLGLKGVSNRDSTYRVMINILKNLHKADLNAAMGISALCMLYGIRSGCNWAAARYPNKRKFFFFLATLRAVFIILLYTFISYLVNRNHRQRPKFRILGTVHRGFQHVQVPKVTMPMIRTMLPNLPAVVIVLVLEHISIAKSFGRINNYTIDPSQELVAIGMTNLLGPFLGSYPATGSFSRTAIQAKAGARTPFTGIITAAVVLLAIYALTSIFFFVPNASLSAIIIHAVGDLITSPDTLYQFWRVSPLEVVIYFISVILAVFTNIENGIYAAIFASAAVLFFRIFKAKGHFLGRVKVHSVIGDHLIEDEEGKELSSKKYQTVRTGASAPSREIYLPVDHHDGSNPAIDLPISPVPGIFIFRFSEGYNYPSASHYLDHMVEVIFRNTRKTAAIEYGRQGDRPWNDYGPIRSSKSTAVLETRPTLKAIILDFASVNNVDVTSVQHLIDVRNQLDRYTAPEKVDWHFAHVNNRWAKRALASAGFGFPSPQDGFDGDVSGVAEVWAPIFSVAELGGIREADGEHHRANLLSRLSMSRNRASVALEDRENIRLDKLDVAEEGRAIHTENKDLGSFGSGGHGESSNEKAAMQAHEAQTETLRHALIHSINRPFFHIDLVSALQSARVNAARRERHLRPVSVIVDADDVPQGILPQVA